ncbi:MAG: 1-acyl-sn-glycerol-3-phosphate acyltransferase, partial [Desulfomicrobium sp.]|nr:1-acyl-sn-glycerol-3-phosphate acyltransferase [Desulfomicrobium sp.]
MNTEVFPDPYHSPLTPVAPFARLFPGLAFYARVVSIVCEAAWRTRKGYTMAKWAQDSRTFIRRAESCG